MELIRCDLDFAAEAIKMDRDVAACVKNLLGINELFKATKVAGAGRTKQGPVLPLGNDVPSGMG